jgi:hypothetical protein
MLPTKYDELLQRCEPLLKQGRPGDYEHALETANMVADYNGGVAIDKDVLIPVAIMHDIGHSAILPEHFDYVTGTKKLINGKLVHMLAGAKIAKDILTALEYDTDKINEIVDIIRVHDADALTGLDTRVIYNTDNKKLFSDIDKLDRFSQQRIDKISARNNDKTEIMKLITQTMDLFFFDDFKKIATERLKTIK